MGLELAVVGAGRWGSALGAAAARNGHQVVLWSSRANLAHVEGCSRTTSLADLRGRKIFFFTVAPEQARSAARELAPIVGPEAIVIHAVRGLTDDPVTTIADLLAKETCIRRVGALGGPVLVSELEEGSPTLFACGSAFPEVLAVSKELLANKQTRVATTADRRGVEWSSALVACLALGVGYVQGAGYGPGLVAAITSEAVREAARFVVAMGGQESTMLGLAGGGDLLAAVAQKNRPEILVGRALASGRALEEVERETGQRVVASDIVPKLVRVAKDRDLHFRLLGMLVRGAFSGKPAREVVKTWIESAL